MISRAPTRRLPMARQQQPAMGRQQGFAPPRTQMQQQRQAQPAQGGGFAAYRPGQAQPKAPPSQGTGYGGGFGTMGGGQSDPRWSHNGGAWNSGQQPKAQAGGVAFPQGYTYRPPQRGQQPSTMPPPSGYHPPQTFPTPPGYGQPQPTPDWAREGYRPDPNGPATGGGFMLPPGLGGPAIGGDAYGPGPINNAAPPFRSEMKDQFGNPTTPEQFYPQQQAMIGRMYDQFKKMDTGVYLGQGAPPPSWGQAKPLDIPSLWNQAGKDVQAGWQNPYMPGNAQPIQPPSQGMPYNPFGPIAFDAPVIAPAAGLGYTERPLSQEEFLKRQGRPSRNIDQFVDPFANYEQYLQSGAMGGQNWLPPAPPTLARQNYQF